MWRKCNTFPLRCVRIDPPCATLYDGNHVPHQKLFLIDTFGFIFRAYHARARSAAPPMRTSTGLSTEAVYIFNNMVRKLSNEHKPEYIAAIFESGAPTHRVEEFAMQSLGTFKDDVPMQAVPVGE